MSDGTILFYSNSLGSYAEENLVSSRRKTHNYLALDQSPENCNKRDAEKGELKEKESKETECHRHPLIASFMTWRGVDRYVHLSIHLNIQLIL